MSFTTTPLTRRKIPFISLPLPLIATIILQLLLSSPAHTRDRELTVSQEATLPGWYDAELGFKNPYIDGTFALRGDDPLPAPENFPDSPVNPFADLSLRTWSVAVKPIRFVTVTAGSLSVTGLPARAKNPFFLFTRPRYTPLEPSHKPVISKGTSLNSDNLALECGGNHWKIAAAGDPRNGLDDPAWIFVSRLFGSSDASRTKDAPAHRLSLSLFGGAKTLSQSEESTWFLEEPLRPKTNLYVPGAEAIYSGRIFSGSATVLASFGPFLEPGYFLRGEGSLSGRHLSLTLGAAQSTDQFLPLDGKKESLIRRIFAAPALTIPLAKTRFPQFTLGGLVIQDLCRRERYYEEDSKEMTAGGFCAATAGKSSLEFRYMAKKGESDLSGRLLLDCSRKVPLAFAANAETTLTGESSGPIGGKDQKASLGAVWRQPLAGSKKTAFPGAATFESAVTGTVFRAEEGEPVELSGTLSLAFSVSGKHSRWKIRTEAGVSQGKTPWTGTIGLETTFK